VERTTKTGKIDASAQNKTPGVTRGCLAAYRFGVDAADMGQMSRFVKDSL